MEDKILDILLNMQNDISTIKNDQAIIKEDVSGLKEDVSGLKEDVSGLKEDVSGLKEDVVTLKKNQKSMKKIQTEMKKEQKEMKKTLGQVQVEQQQMKKTQDDILEELRLGNLKLSQLSERVEKGFEENTKEHKEFFPELCILLKPSHHLRTIKRLCYPHMPPYTIESRPGTGALNRKPGTLKGPGYLCAQPAYATPFC